jgi:hypothetical protein
MSDRHIDCATRGSLKTGADLHFMCLSSFQLVLGSRIFNIVNLDEVIVMLNFTKKNLKVITMGAVASSAAEQDTTPCLQKSPSVLKSLNRKNCTAKTALPVLLRGPNPIVCLVVWNVVRCKYRVDMNHLCRSGGKEQGLALVGGP